jgi:hypothetical protein
MTRLVIAAPHRLALHLGALASISCAMGCALASEEIGVVQEAGLNSNGLNSNGLNSNGLNSNGLNSNGLNSNGLNSNGLNSNAMSPAAMSAIQDPSPTGDLSRELLRYTVSCAFTPSQSFAFSWTDEDGATHQEAYLGLLGLAPSWATQPLDLTGQQWVSSCLASRVNAKDISVMLSSRGTHPALATTSSERAAYQTREAVFFGNLFTDSPRVYACYDPLSVLPSQMASRVCALPDLLALNLNNLTGGYNCGPIQVVGPCTQVLGLITLGVCASQKPTDRYFYNCSAPGSATSVPSITTFLKGPIPW